MLYFVSISLHLFVLHSELFHGEQVIGFNDPIHRFQLCFETDALEIPEGDDRQDQDNRGDTGSKVDPGQGRICGHIKRSSCASPFGTYFCERDIYYRRSHTAKYRSRRVQRSRDQNDLTGTSTGVFLISSIQ